MFFVFLLQTEVITGDSYNYPVPYVRRILYSAPRQLEDLLEDMYVVRQGPDGLVTISVVLVEGGQSGDTDHAQEEEQTAPSHAHSSYTHCCHGG